MVAKTFKRLPYGTSNFERLIVENYVYNTAELHRSIKALALNGQAKPFVETDENSFLIDIKQIKL